MFLKLTRGWKITIGVLLVPIIALGIYAYIGSYLGEEYSPDGQYTLKYYQSFNPLLVRFVPGTPGNSPCRAVWVRL